jgi:hypothetical protein
MEQEYQKRGWFLVRAQYPEVFVLMSAPHLRPFGIHYALVIDFTDYDLIAPSVRFVNPFTRETLTRNEVLPLHKRSAAGPAVAPPPSPVIENANANVKGGEGEASPDVALTSLPSIGRLQTGNLVQGHDGHAGFLCVEGTREYHAHPYHSNNPWLAHRDKGIGCLHYLLDVVWRHGILPLLAYQVVMNIQIGAPRPDPARIP